MDFENNKKIISNVSGVGSTEIFNFILGTSIAIFNLPASINLLDKLVMKLV